ncbi:MAG: DUF3311 domain-containing protein [Planctomycetes bacterium]|nr:DUF3311 domain-containing protein [Planctomycetota bacterium]
MRVLVYGLLVLLAIVHQDYWWWDKIDPLVFGFVPIGLAYHAGVSIVAAILWAMAVKYCWPADADVVDAMGGSGVNDGDHA